MIGKTEKWLTAEDMKEDKGVLEDVKSKAEIVFLIS
jgi:hypothetical protein